MSPCVGAPELSGPFGGWTNNLDLFRAQQTIVASVRIETAHQQLGPSMPSWDCSARFAVLIVSKTESKVTAAAT